MLVKALMEWLASLWYEMVEYLLDQLMELFNVNLTYFAARVPVVNEIGTIFIAVGWALLIGNLAYQSIRSMVSGIGIDAEEPGRLFLRTAIFGFLLLISRQICEIGFGISSTVMDMLQVPEAVTFEPFDADYFSNLPNAGWLIVIIVNIMIQWQLIKLFFEVAERYVILCFLTYCAPLAFSMGGSKSTGDIFRGWVRMFASMCTLMVFNLVFVKLVLSALSTSPNGVAIIPWAMLVTGIVRVAKKMDGIILRIGMTPALTGDPLGSRIPGMLTMMAVRSMAGMVAQTFAKSAPSGAMHGTAGGMADKVHNAGVSGAGKKSHANPREKQRAETQQTKTQGDNAQQTNTQSTQHSKTMQSGSVRTSSRQQQFPQRSGVDDTTMRKVRKAISIDADDFDDAPISTSADMHGTSPVPPPLHPLAADFAQTAPPPIDEHRPRPAASPTLPNSHSITGSIKGGSFTPRGSEPTISATDMSTRHSPAPNSTNPVSIADTSGELGSSVKLSGTSALRPTASPVPPSKEFMQSRAAEHGIPLQSARMDTESSIQTPMGIESVSIPAGPRPAASPSSTITNHPESSQFHMTPDSTLLSASKYPFTPAPRKRMADSSIERPAPTVAPASRADVQHETLKTHMSPEVQRQSSYRPPSSPLTPTISSKSGLNADIASPSSERPATASAPSSRAGAQSVSPEVQRQGIYRPPSSPLMPTISSKSGMNADIASPSSERPATASAPSSQAGAQSVSPEVQQQGIYRPPSSPLAPPISSKSGLNAGIGSSSNERPAAASDSTLRASAHPVSPETQRLGCYRPSTSPQAPVISHKSEGQRHVDATQQPFHKSIASGDVQASLRIPPAHETGQLCSKTEQKPLSSPTAQPRNLRRHMQPPKSTLPREGGGTKHRKRKKK